MGRGAGGGTDGVVLWHGSSLSKGYDKAECVQKTPAVEDGSRVKNERSTSISMRLTGRLETGVRAL